MNKKIRKEGGRGNRKFTWWRIWKSEDAIYWKRGRILIAAFLICRRKAGRHQVEVRHARENNNFQPFIWRNQVPNFESKKVAKKNRFVARLLNDEATPMPRARLFYSSFCNPTVVNVEYTYVSLIIGFRFLINTFLYFICFLFLSPFQVFPIRSDY